MKMLKQYFLLLYYEHRLFGWFYSVIIKVSKVFLQGVRLPYMKKIFLFSLYSKLVLNDALISLSLSITNIASFSDGMTGKPRLIALSWVIPKSSGITLRWVNCVSTLISNSKIIFWENFLSPLNPALMSRLWTGFFGTESCRTPKIFQNPDFSLKRRDFWVFV